jgi:capsular exopolysaccharide synthesis family protein
MKTLSDSQGRAYTGPMDTDPQAQKDADPREFFRLLWRRKWIILLCLILIPLAAYVYSDRLTKSYQSSAIIQVQGTATDAGLYPGQDLPTAPANTAKIAALISTSGVTDQASRILGEPPGSLRGAVTASDNDKTEFITITATAGSGQRAAQIANAIAKALRTTREKAGIRRVDASIANVEKELADLPPGEALQRSQLSERLQGLRALRAAQSQNLQVIESAAVPTSPVSPNPKRNAILAFVVALLIAAGAAALAERLDRRLHDSRDLERLTGTPLLAQVPTSAFPGAAPDPNLPIVFQTLRDSLTYFNVDQRLASLLVISPLKGDGKTSVSTNLAVAFARAGKQVILVDADLRSPQVAHRMGTPLTPGLSEVISGSSDIHEALSEIEPFGPYLRVLAGGSIPPNPSEMLGSARMSTILAELSEMSDLVVIDSAPVLVVSDAFPLFEQVAGIVGVSRLEQTPREAISRAISVASSAGGRVLGMVATGAKQPGDGYGYGYGQAYGDTPSAAADPHFLAASGGGQTTGKPVTRRVRQFFRSG